MIILPPAVRIFPVFLAVSTTDKPVNRSILACSLTQLNVFALWGFIFREIHKKKQGRSSNNSGYKIQNYVTGKYTRARAPWARMYTDRTFESKGGTKSMKTVY